MKSILIVETDACTYARELEKQNLPDARILLATATEEAKAYAAQAQIILGRPDFVAPLLHLAENLTWVQSTYAGIEPLCAAGLRRDYLLTGVKEVFGPLMSEYVFGQILARERHFAQTHENQQKHHWHPLAYRGLDGLTIGIIGLGSIGCHVAKTSAHFNMRVLGMKRTAGKIAHVDRIFLPAERSEFFPQLDYLVITLPDTPETRGFIRLSDLKMMKETAVLINVGRGVNVCQDDLITALTSGYIGGAVLDVFEKEPLPADSPLWKMEQVTITPHNSAFSFPEQITAIFCSNYRKFCAGEPLDYVVDFDRNY